MRLPIVSISRLMALFSYIALFFFLVYLIVGNVIYPDLPRGPLVIGLLVPLLFPSRGLLRAQRYTHAWTSFLSLLYFVVATDLWSSGEHGVSSVIFLLTILLFTGCVLYSRYSPLPFREGRVGFGKRANSENSENTPQK
mgnify:FL=1